VAVRARVAGWHLPAGNASPGFVLEVTDADHPKGEEHFPFAVHTPATIERVLVSRGAMLGRGIIVVEDDYDPERVAETIRPVVESMEGSSWEELAFRIGSLTPWEFEGWRWDPDRERIREDPGVSAEVRDVRLVRTSTGLSFSLPVEVRFGAAGADDLELTVPMTLHSPLWLRNQLPSDAVMLGAGRMFAVRPDGGAIREALAGDVPARAPSWDLLRLALTPPRSLGT
jgi:hypothetical protein